MDRKLSIIGTQEGRWT